MGKFDKVKPATDEEQTLWLTLKAKQKEDDTAAYHRYCAVRTEFLALYSACSFDVGYIDLGFFEQLKARFALCHHNHFVRLYELSVLYSRHEVPDYDVSSVAKVFENRWNIVYHAYPVAVNFKASNYSDVFDIAELQRQAEESSEYDRNSV